MNGQPTIPPNIWHFSEGVRQMGLTAQHEVASTSGPSARTATPLSATDLLARIDMLANDMRDVQVGLEATFNQCFVTEQERMHDDQPDARFVSGQLAVIQRRVDALLRYRREFASTAVDADFEAVRRLTVHMLDGQIAQFAKFASELPERLVEGSRSGAEHVKVSLVLDPTDDVRYLERTLMDAVNAHRQHSARRQTHSRRSSGWSWFGWVLLVLVLAWREFNKLTLGTGRRRR